MSLAEVLKLLKALVPLDFKQAIRRLDLMRKYKSINLKVGLNVNIIQSKLGKNLFIGSNVIITQSEIGDFSYINASSSVNNSQVGKFCSIASNVAVNLGEHPLHFVSCHPAFYSKGKEVYSFSDNEYFQEIKSVKIGNDVWIGYGSLVKGGVNIGDGAVIAANSVVTKDIEPYTIVGGVPAKVIKKRFDAETINRLLEIKWWDFDESELRKNFLLFQDMPKFLSQYYKNS